MRRVTLKAGLISFVVCAMLAGVAPMAAAAATPKAADGLGAAAGFAVLADSTGGVNCTNSTVIGLVGLSGPDTPIVQVGCALNHQVASGAYDNFLSAHGASLASCTRTFTDSDTLAGLSLSAGTYCFPAGATLTGTLTLKGGGPWLFQIGGTTEVGALTATDFNVVGSNPCNATWWVQDAATLTRAAFQGTILAGKDITLTNTSLTGRALATGAVTMTDSNIVGCTAGGTVAKPAPIGKGELNAAACNAVGKPVIDVNEKVLADADSGLAGAWAFDTYNRHIQVWPTVANTWCAVVTWSGGKFAAITDATSPGNTVLIGANVKGDFSGGYRAIITGALLTPATWPTHGNVGTFNYACDTSFNCPGYVDWVGQYFTSDSTFAYAWWGWSYKASGHHGTWVNSSDGNSGDIF